MAATSKTTKRARELDALGRAEAKRKYLHDELNESEIASDLHVATVYIVRLARDERWADELSRLCCSREYLEAHEKASKDLANCKVKIEVTHARTAVHRARAQHAVARALAEEAAAATTSKQVHDLARVLGPASQDITSGRLSVGLTTEKTESVVEIESAISELRAVLRGDSDGGAEGGTVDGLPAAQPTEPRTS